jgi:hypothetical protein
VLIAWRLIRRIVSAAGLLPMTLPQHRIALSPS